MRKESNLESTENNECPKCKFAGVDSDTTKFDIDFINKCPKGYAHENYPKIKTVKRAGEEIQEFVKDEKMKQVIFEKKRRCPKCGHREDDKE